jgi:hypothetical protein
MFEKAKKIERKEYGAKKIEFKNIDGRATLGFSWWRLPSLNDRPGWASSHFVQPRPNIIVREAGKRSV